MTAVGRSRDTVDGSNDSSDQVRPRPQPGIVWTFENGAPASRAQAADADGRLVIDRSTIDDERVSRPHAELRFDDGRWRIRDLGSRNGTFLDGRRVVDEAAFDGVLRVGSSIALLCADLDAYGAVVTAEDVVIGAALRRALDSVAQAAEGHHNLLLTGETGCGKEVAARAFHQASGRGRRPFVPVNCAAVPTAIAERLFFGAKRGAYSGADADAIGYVQAADGGVLFLDEVGELDLDVQAKLLRLLDSHELLPLGAATARRVDVVVCFATHRDLRAAVARGTLRSDLFFRIAEPSVTIPPLRRRREEIPFLIAHELARSGAAVPHALFVEECLLRDWPGNVRELRATVRAAALRAIAEGGKEVRRRHLSAEAGRALAPAEPSGARSGAPAKEAVEEALSLHGGNVAAAARALGLHRTQLYRLIKRLGIAVQG